MLQLTKFYLGGSSLLDSVIINKVMSPVWYLEFLPVAWNYSMKNGEFVNFSRSIDILSTGALQDLNSLYYLFFIFLFFIILLTREKKQVRALVFVGFLNAIFFLYFKKKILILSNASCNIRVLGSEVDTFLHLLTNKYAAITFSYSCVICILVIFIFLIIWLYNKSSSKNLLKNFNKKVPVRFFFTVIYLKSFTLVFFHRLKKIFK
jgi:hypothetical protein